MAKLQLMDLSTDLQSLILSYIIRPTDLVSLCLTCKQFHEIAVRTLYHTITLDLGSEADKKLPSLLKPENIGLKHIRNIELYKAEVGLCGVMRQADIAMRMLLEFLPEDQLERWSFHPWSPFSADNMCLLYKKQKKMKWLEAILLDKPFCQCIKRELKLDTVMEHVTKLGLYPENRDTLEFSNELLRRSKNLKKITLHANFEPDEVENSIPLAELNDGPTEPGLVTRTIFRHMLPFQDCQPMALSELTLQKVHLRYAADSYCKAIDFSKLNSLRIFECPGADALLAALCQSSRLPSRLETLEFKHEDDGRDCETTTALNGFLCLVSGVERLTVDVAGTKNLIGEASIVRHSRTLKILNVHATLAKSHETCEEDEHVYDTEAFEKVCKACTLLEQLCVAFPSTSITRHASDDFAAFSAALGTLPNLVTLNITSWPSATSNSSRMPRKMYEQLLQGMAQVGFEVSIANARMRSLAEAAAAQAATSSAADVSSSFTLPDSSTSPTNHFPSHSHGAFALHVPTLPNTTSPANPKYATPSTSKLNVIAWGTSDKIHEREDSKNCIIFVKGKQVDPLGRGESVLATQMGWCLRRYFEPRTEVLDFALMKSTRPPTREPLGSDDGDWL